MSEQTKQKLSRNWNRIEYEFERWVKFFVSQLMNVYFPLCGPYRGLHHLTNPMNTLFPPYPNRIALHIY